MSKIDELIKQLCPNGVEFKQLGQVGFSYGGLSGKNKADFQNGNAKFITYMNIYSNISVDTDMKYFVRVGKKIKTKLNLEMCSLQDHLKRLMNMECLLC